MNALIDAAFNRSRVVMLTLAFVRAWFLPRSALVVENLALVTRWPF